MATGVVKSAISSVVEKTPFSYSRSCKLRKWAQEIMDKSSQGESEMNCFDKYCSEVIKHLQTVATSATSK